MKWTTEAELKSQLQKRWEKGEFLQNFLQNEPLFPLKLTLKKPTSNDITNEFQAVKQWAALFSVLSPYRVEWQTVNHRIQGEQKLPTSIWVDTLENALVILRKQKEFKLFQQLTEQALNIDPRLQIWLEKRPLKALELADDWQKLLAVLVWRKTHSQPNCYLRQVSLQGVHSKFIETHRGVLAEWFDLVLPESEIQADKTGANQFNARYGFLDKPEFIRFRLLDSDLTFAGLAGADISLDAASFAQLDLNVSTVLIVENEINYLSLPPMKNTLAIWGAGYGFSALRQANWLKTRQLYYWGDIDTHGFAILNQLRADFPKVKSVLMTLAILEKYRIFWREESKPSNAVLPYLTEEEQTVYSYLQQQSKLRLEQESILFTDVEEALRQLV